MVILHETLHSSLGVPIDLASCVQKIARDKIDGFTLLVAAGNQLFSTRQLAYPWQAGFLREKGSCVSSSSS